MSICSVILLFIKSDFSLHPLKQFINIIFACFIFSKFSSEIFLIQRRILLVFILNFKCLYINCPFIFSAIEETWSSLTNFSKDSHVRWERSSMQIDRRTKEQRERNTWRIYQSLFAVCGWPKNWSVFVLYSFLVDYNALFYTYLRMFVYVSFTVKCIIPLMCRTPILSCNKALKIKITTLSKYLIRKAVITYIMNPPAL